MKAMELVRHRRSVRTFDGTALRPEDARRVLEYAEGVENPYGLDIEWRLLDAKSKGLASPVIVGADTFIAGKMAAAPHAAEAFGYAFERVVLCAEEMGLGTTWIAGTMDRPAFEKAMELGDGEVMPCISPLGYPAPKMSLREGLMRKGVRADSRMDFGAVFFDRAFGAPLSPQRAGAIAEALELVRLAPSAVNKQPWRVVVDGPAVHFFEKHSRGYVDGSGWDIQRIDMGIALCHFALGLEEAGIRADFALDAPQIQAPAGVDYIASYVIA